MTKLIDRSFWPFDVVIVGIARNIRQLFYVRTTGCVRIPFIGRVR